MGGDRDRHGRRPRVALDNLALWIPIGLVLGFAIGTAMGSPRRGDS